ncbi:DUF21 domain-containing protein [Cucumis melo var. makuwa]|uniref:DUF21 domain-containing protein n=1 Tax=Cucumis melo var. makuwa TaxID=1194695 RepID=A0A5D3DWR1_CUCMM|nr:DUF21 domain-containing protein [Cucumis melo var. makuwa]
MPNAAPLLVESLVHGGSNDVGSMAILPVVQKQHQLLVTLLLCNVVAMEALPIYLDKLFNQYVAIILSVTFVLAFGEVVEGPCDSVIIPDGAPLSAYQYFENVRNFLVAIEEMG